MGQPARVRVLPHGERGGFRLGTTGSSLARMQLKNRFFFNLLCFCLIISCYKWLLKLHSWSRICCYIVAVMITPLAVKSRISRCCSESTHLWIYMIFLAIEDCRELEELNFFLRSSLSFRNGMPCLGRTRGSRRRRWRLSRRSPTPSTCLH